MSLSIFHPFPSSFIFLSAAHLDWDQQRLLYLHWSHGCCLYFYTQGILNSPILIIRKQKKICSHVIDLAILPGTCSTTKINWQWPTDFYGSNVLAQIKKDYSHTLDFQSLLDAVSDQDHVLDSCDLKWSLSLNFMACWNYLGEGSKQNRPQKRPPKKPQTKPSSKPINQPNPRKKKES